MESKDLYEQNQEYIGAIAELGRDNERLRKQLEKSLKLFKQIAKLTDEYPVLKVNELAHKGIEELNK